MYFRQRYDDVCVAQLLVFAHAPTLGYATCAIRSKPSGGQITSTFHVRAICFVFIHSRTEGKRA